MRAEKTAFCCSFKKVPEADNCFMFYRVKMGVKETFKLCLGRCVVHEK